MNGCRGTSMKHTLFSALRAAVLGAALLASACGGAQQQEAPPPAPVPVADPIDPATAGGIRGTVRFEGTVPPAQPINTESDPYCQEQGTLTTETVAVGSGSGLQNVFVYVKDGLGNRVFTAPATPVVLDQKGCRYTPHVFGIQVGQPLEILSSDDTLHNVHAMPSNNREFNKAHQAAGVRHTHTFSAREVMVPFKCDVHKWMNAYLGVLDHPFYAVTGEDGAFELKGLPPGTYIVEAWHETLGTQTQTVTVGAKQTSDTAFTFKL
jgi:plastocyanin